MSRAEDLLNSLSVDDEEVITRPLPTDRIVIGEDRSIFIPDELKRIAVQHDHNIETITFDCPRYWDGHDMSTMQIYINYMRADKVPGSYVVESASVDEYDNTIMHFDWTITRNVTSVHGQIAFLVCINKTDSKGNETSHWNSELSRGMYVSEGLECQETIIESYPDIITHVLTRLKDFEDIESGNTVASIEQTKTSTEDNGWNEVTVTLSNGVQSIFVFKNGSKGDQGIGIQSVNQTVTSTENGGINEVVITLTNGESTTIRIQNGKINNDDVLITLDDIDAICGASMYSANDVLL